MIKRLYLSNCFSHHDREFIFENGVTTITGPNESGKSLIPEMIRYCLFGVEALRGTSDDYKKLVAELDFEVREQLYRVHRDRRKTMLQKWGNNAWVDYATSITAVNKKIPEILGYQGTVFDVANCVKQGEVEALGNMISSKRKEMVDQTIGLNHIESLIEWAGQQSRFAKGEAEAIENTMSPPIEPEKPADYQPSQQLQLRHSELDTLVKEKKTLEGWLSHERKQPTKPQCDVTETATELKAVVEARDKIFGKTQTLELQLKQLPESKFTATQLDEKDEHLSSYRKWEHKQMHLAKGVNKCPKCGYEWHIAADILKEFENVKEVGKPNFDERTLRKLKDDFELAQQRNGIEEQLKALVIPEDRSSDYHKRSAYEISLPKYEQEKIDYDDFATQYKTKQNRLTELDGIEEKRDSVHSSFTSATNYERDMEKFEGLKKSYEKSLKIVTEKKELAEQYQKVKKALQKLKSRIKGYLVPSLNSVSSKLLSEMTGGVRNQIEIDEEFNIKVDSQPLQTLSGSGKAVANLAIRIGLGQVLTNKVFSVFMADEIDASMDDERAEYTAQCLRRLSSNIAQIFLVSHKRPEANYYIDLHS